MRRHFAGDSRSALACRANQFQRRRRRNVRDMPRLLRLRRDSQIAGDDRIFRLAVRDERREERRGAAGSFAQNAFVGHRVAVVRKATAPAAASAAKSQGSTPARPRVIAPIGTIRQRAQRCASPMSVRSTRGSSSAGFVFGMQATVVNPPRTAASVPVAIVSFSGNPGSRKCTCMSMNPGAITAPPALRTASPSPASRCSPISRPVRRADRTSRRAVERRGGIDEPSARDEHTITAR